MRYKYTKEDIEFLEKYYPLGNWDLIHQRFPSLSDSAIHSKCSRLGIKFDLSKRQKYDYSKGRKYWTDEEIEILKNNYSLKQMSEIEKLLPNRSKHMIASKAVSLNLESYTSLSTKWKDNEIQYIKNNWFLTPDILMAQELNRTQRAVQAKRLELGFQRTGINNKSYPTLSKYLRGQNYDWKIQSMKQCEYKCVLTGSKNFEIHHLYGLSNIISDLLNDYSQYQDISFDQLSDETLNFLTEKFLEYQNKYPLGECIRKDLHVLFHSLYGQYYNTPEQWYRFKEDYRNGVYQNIA